MTKNTPGGYNGKLLRVDLSSKTTRSEEIDEQTYRWYIGGAGFVTYFLWKELKPGVDALGPGNKIIFALGPISGLQLPGAARHCVGAKSPLTGGIAKSEVGGFWAAEFKRAGYDAIIIEGRAEKPVYLLVKDGKASIQDATHLWGKETKETQDTIRAEQGDERIQMALIGPAGENQVRFACIMHGLHDAAGRGGLGAVMGSKNLKAVAVRGQKLPKIIDSEVIKEIRQQKLAQPHHMSKFGTGGPEMGFFETSGNLPIRNFRDGVFPSISKLSSVAMQDDPMWVGMDGCFACPVRCKKVVQFDEPYHVHADYGAPEYETIASLGSNCGVDNLKVVVRGNERCGAYSLDTISTGGVIAFAMECFEKGLLSSKDTDGIELKFGNGKAVLEVIDLIARRQGIGNQLAEGTARLAKKIGRDSQDFAMNVKGLECGLHEPRLSAGLGLGYMVNPHGADHCTNIIDHLFLGGPGIVGLHHLAVNEPLPPHDIGPRKVSFFKAIQQKKIIDDCLSMCSFVDYSADKEAVLVAAATGWSTGAVELMKVAERVLTTARLFNIREGFSADDDVLPKRFFQPKTDGALSDVHPDPAKFEEAKRYYYTLMGWDANGVPLPAKISDLGIE